MKKLLAACIAALLLASPCHAGTKLLLGVGNPPVAAAGGCSQATTFLARTSLAGADVTNYTTLICGMVTDGIITGDLSTTGCGSLFDVFYVFATADATSALLNICGTSFTGLNANSLTFTAYSGFTGDGAASHYIDTQFNPTTATSPDFTQNSAHLSIWNLTSGTSGIPVINDNGFIVNNTYPKFTDNNIYARINDGGSAGFAITDPRGLLLGNRSSSTARQLYQNGSTTLDGGVVATYGSEASSTPANNNIELLGNGVAIGSLRTLAAASIGGSLNSTQQSNFYSRLRTYMTAVGVP